MQNLPFQFQFASIQNYQLALQKTWFAGINNGAKTLNGISLISDAFTLSQYPDIVDELCNSRSFIRKICTHKIDKTYQKEIKIDINKNLLSGEELDFLRNQFNNIIKLPDNPKTFEGRMSYQIAVKEALYLAEKHGGSMLMAVYEGEKDFTIPLNIEKEVRTDAKLFFIPISISGTNTHLARQFFQILSNGNEEEMNGILKQFDNNKRYNTSYPRQNEIIDLQIQKNFDRRRVHTSRLIPILSSYKNYSIRNTWYQGWDNSILQGAMKSIINYYLFLDTLPEMIREKILNKVMIDKDIGQINEKTYSGMQEAVKKLGEKLHTTSWAVLPQNTQIQRDELSLGGIQEIHNALQAQIIMDTDSIKADLVGEGNGGLGSGGDEHMVRMAHEKLARIHEKYDWVFQYVYSRILKNRFNDTLKDVAFDNIQIVFDNTPTETAEERRTFQKDIIDRLITMGQAGILSGDDIKEKINALGIPELAFVNKVDL